ncbi:MAG: endolytic transglycosylase MltG [Desulfatirhabdiaceae bacterium]|nr:endolytic transglycosylase MltG [Desulfatirhabdiaceae bacterium]
MSKSGYEINWATDHLAVGGAPLSYEELDRIKASGIGAILNLCAEYCDLHDIEAKHGFDVHYLPIHDEKTPDIAELDKAMAWMDEIIRQNKKVLIHCRLGIGRTGTVLYAYLSSRGLKSRLQEAAVQELRCRPSNYCQWQLVKQYGREEGACVNGNGVDASKGFFLRFCLAISALLMLILSILAIWTACDVVEYANTAGSRPSREELITVLPRQQLKATADMLFDSEIIRAPTSFYLYARAFGYARRIQAGEYLLSGGMTPKQILEIMASGKVFLHKITIPEGYNLKEIAAVFAGAGLVSESQFLDAARDPQMCRGWKIEADTAEGYLFPDTYYFPRGVSAEKILSTMIQQFRQVFTSAMAQQAEKMGLSIHQAVTLASIIEKETGSDSERPMVSSVFHNRLKRRMRLESDPTVIYGIDNFDGNITRRHLRTPTPYNTYTRQGLPPGPIASPGARSLLAAVYPAQSEFLFFVSRQNKTHQFSRTWDEHLKAVRKYQLGGN